MARFKLTFLSAALLPLFPQAGYAAGAGGGLGGGASYAGHTSVGNGGSNLASGLSGTVNGTGGAGASTVVDVSASGSDGAQSGEVSLISLGAPGIRIGGGGGGGGYVTITNNSTVIAFGGNGGKGANFSIGVYSSNAGLIVGGGGGAGGAISWNSNTLGVLPGTMVSAVRGGNGGDAVELAGAITSFSNSGTLWGGGGGSAGNVSDLFAGTTLVGFTGSGGTGLVVTSNSTTVNNTGTIHGGDAGNAAMNPNLSFGGNGVRVSGNSGHIIQAGTIVGGLDSDVVTRREAVLINGQGNTLTLHPTSITTGNVIFNGANNRLQIGTGSTATATINGSVSLGSGGVFSVRAIPAAMDRLNVTGNAAVNQATVEVLATPGAYSDNFSQIILHADGTLSGSRFTGVTSDLAYLTPSLSYSVDDRDVTLTLTRTGSGTPGGAIRFEDLVNSANARGAANAIDALPVSHPLHNAAINLAADTPATVFASLSGDTHSTVASSVNMLSAQAPNISQQHLRNNLTAGLRAGAPIAQSDGPLPASAFPSSKVLPAWVEVVGHWQKMDGNSNAPGVKQNTTGLFLGADEEVGNSGWRVGGSVGYTSADAKVNSRDASADISSYSAAVYTGKGFSHAGNRINVIGGLAYTKHSIESERSVATLNQNLKADYSAHTAQLFAEVGYAMGQYDKQGFEPFVGITLGEQRTNSFKESGGFAALSSESSRDTLASTTLGVRAHSDFVLAGKDTRVRGTLGVRHAWGNLSQNRTMAFEGSSSFTVAGAPLARNTALVGLQAEMALSRYSALVLGYNGEYGSGSRDQSASVKVRWAF